MGRPRTATGERATKVVTGRGVTGLQERTAASGDISYRLRVQFREKTISLTWAHAEKIVARAAARDWAVDIIARVNRGEDPRMVIPGALTIRSACARWVFARRRKPGQGRAKKPWKRSTAWATLALIRRRIVPGFGDRDANSIHEDEVHKQLQQIADRNPTEANRTFSLWTNLYGWLRHRNQRHLGVTVNPTIDLDKPASEKPRDVTYTDEQLRELITKAPDYIRLVALTGVRDSEARLLSFSEVDFDRSLWTVPGSRTKSGQPHQVPLSRQALALIRSKRAQFLQRPWVKTRPTEKLTEIGLRPHDLRRTVGDRVKAAHGEAMMHSILGHVDAVLTRTYGPSPRLAARAEALQWWADQLDQILGVPDERRA